MSTLKSRVEDKILTIYFTEGSILEEARIRQLGDEMIDILGKTDEENVVLDFRTVGFMSSAMLGTLVRFHKKCKEYKASLKLCAISPKIIEVFKLTKLDKLFDIYPDEAAARAACVKKSGWFGR